MNSIPRLGDHNASSFLPSVQPLHRPDSAPPAGAESFAEVLNKLTTQDTVASRATPPQQQLLVAVHVDAHRGAHALIAAQGVSAVQTTETARAVSGAQRTPELTPVLSALAQVEQARQLAAQVAVQQAVQARGNLTPRAVPATDASAAIRVSLSAADTPNVNVLVQLSTSASRLSNMLKLKQAEDALELLRGKEKDEAAPLRSSMAAAAAVAFYQMVGSLDEDCAQPLHVSVRA